jgi:hypothetical protein
MGSRIKLSKNLRALGEGVVVDAIDCSIDCSLIKVVSISFVEPRVAVKCDKGLLAADNDSGSRCNAGFRFLLEDIAFIGLTGIARSLRFAEERGV